jgi:hypothetical protein
MITDVTALGVSDAARNAKLRIAEVQNGSGLLARKIAKLSVTEAAELYLTRRESGISRSTVRLERDALKQVERHLGTASARIRAVPDV